MTFRFIEELPNVLASQRQYLIKEHLKTVGWTVPSSSDGTTYNAAGDQITHGSSGANGLGNTNAWVRIRSPDNSLEITLQRAVNDNTYRIKLARAPMNAGTPGATQTPTTTTATDEIVVLGAGTDAAPTGGSFGFGGGTAGAQMLKGGADDTSPYGFWFATSTCGSAGSLVPGIFYLDPLIMTIPGDAFLYVVKAGAVETSTGSLSNLDAQANQFSYVASATPTVSINMPAQHMVIGSNIAIPSDVVTTADGRFRELLVRYERRAAAASPGYKGVSSLMKWVTPIRLRWTTLSIDTPHDRIVFGDVSFPWDGSFPRI